MSHPLQLAAEPGAWLEPLLQSRDGAEGSV